MAHGYELDDEQKDLLARWYPTVLGRCHARLWSDPFAAAEVAHNVMLRLAEELARGKTYAVDFGIVVFKVCEWKVKEYLAGRGYDAELDSDLAATGDPFEAVEYEDRVRRLAADLPPGQRQVVELRLLEGLAPDEIATRLGIERNAVDQRWHNAKRTIRGRFGDA